MTTTTNTNNTMTTTIRTKYLCPTETRGARIRATGAGRSRSISYPYELSGEAVHRAAAEALAGGPVGAGKHNDRTGGYSFEAADVPRAWIIRDGNGYRETVDQFPTLSEARTMLKEYRTADPAGAYSVTTRAPRD
jgi:hypothetical protein